MEIIIHMHTFELHQNDVLYVHMVCEEDCILTAYMLILGMGSQLDTDALTTIRPLLCPR